MQRARKGKRTPEQAFALVLREARRKRGISQEALGFEAGYHRTYIGILERGLQNPTLRVILSIAAALNVPAGDLVARVEAVVGKGWKRDPSVGNLD